MTPVSPSTPPPPVVPPVPDAKDCGPPPRRIVALTPAQLAATAARLVDGGLSTAVAAPNYLDVAGVLAGVERAAPTRFSNDANARHLSDDYVAKLVDLAVSLGNLAFDRMSASGADACAKATPIAASCAAGIIDRMGRKAFRRPLAADEKRDLLALFEAERTRAGARTAFTSLVQTLVLSPSFLFRTELGDDTPGITTLSSYEIAQAMSYWLTNAPPDATLSAAADAGKLHDPAVRVSAVRRLLAKPAAAMGQHPLLLIGRVSGLRQFFHEWLEIDRNPAKEDRIYGVRTDPEWTAARNELDILISDTLWNRGGAWDGLLLDDGAYPNGLMAADGKNGAFSYRLPKYPGGLCDPAFPARPNECATGRTPAHVRVAGADLDGPRAGVLTNPMVMASHALFDRTDPVLRGKWVRHTFFCSEPPPPPPTVATLPPPPSLTQTARERLALHSKDGTCAVCHKLMDPIGFGLETYDAVGRWRTRELSPDLEKKGLYYESGREIDPSGVLTAVTVNGKTGDHPFKGARQLAELLVNSQEAQACFVNAALSFALARFDHDGDACARAELRAAFAAGKRDVIDLFARIAEHATFVQRGIP